VLGLRSGGGFHGVTEFAPVPELLSKAQVQPHFAWGGVFTRVAKRVSRVTVASNFYHHIRMR